MPGGWAGARHAGSRLRARLSLVALLNCEVYKTGSLGVLKLELKPSGYTWEFIATPGDSVSDSGWDACR